MSFETLADQGSSAPKSLVWLVIGLFFIWGGATSLNDILNLHATDWLIPRPDLQHVVDHGGYNWARDVPILGPRGAVAF